MRQTRPSETALFNPPGFGIRHNLLSVPSKRGTHSNFGRAARTTAQASSGFTDLKKDAEAEYRKVRDLLPTLESALLTAEHAKVPAQEAEAAWSETHKKQSSLSEEADSALHNLRSALIDAAGGDSEATCKLVLFNLKSRMQRYKSQLGASEWKEFPPEAVSLPLGGAQLMTQVAACRVDGRKYAVACFAVGGPFLHSALQSLLLHWATIRKPGAKWEQPPHGWHTSALDSHSQGSVAWQTHFSSFAPVLEGTAVEEAAVHSIVLQLPLEGSLKGEGAAVPFVLKRTDGGGPEWLKKDGSQDFLLNLSEAVSHFAELEDSDDSSDWETVSSPAPRQSWLSAWGLDWFGAKKSKSDGKGWLGQVTSWEELQQPPRTYPPRQQHLQNLRLLAKALAAHGAGSPVLDTEGSKKNSGSKGGGKALLQACQTLEDTLRALEAADAEAATAQKRHDQLQVVFSRAEDTARHLKKDISHSLDTARKAAVRLRGRTTEITQRDLEILAAQLAEEMSKQEEKKRGRKSKGRQLVFLHQSVMRLSGVEGNLLVQAYLDGPKPDLNPAPNGATKPGGKKRRRKSAAAAAAAAAEAEEREGEGAASEAVAPPAPEFDSVVVSFAVGEDFPDNSFALPLVLHWAGVGHEGGGWMKAPEGQFAAMTKGEHRTGSATQTPLQRYTITLENGDPVFVDPSLYATSLRLPLDTCAQWGARGLEFVLKDKGGNWITRRRSGGGTSNFYVDLPRVD